MSAMRPVSVQTVRRVIPARLVPAFVRRRLDQVWEVAQFRADAEDEMHYLLDRTDRASEVGELAYGYAEQMMLRTYMRWHPRAITRQPVRGIEWLTSRRDLDRGVVLNFAHHHRYDGLFASLARHGPQLTTVAAPEVLDAPPGSALHQHARVVGMGSRMVRSTVGTDGLADLLRQGEIVAIASDFPGRTELSFLGRRVLGSFGATRLAEMTNSPVVVVTTERDPTGSHLQVHPPLEPSDYPDAGALLDDVMARHAAAVLAWPEAFDGPRTRFGIVED
jgi:lauroyl/myristoyl acyltransferase